ncbi:hypothetical protein [Streptomyces sp. NBC_01508]|uniref:hypothetical protein n=1 Tax=Streptomyces sp. NBC_01508 TaxID=2903888 RepID=UPI003869D850
MRISARGSVLGAVALSGVLLLAVTGCSSDSGEGVGGSPLLGGLAALGGGSEDRQVAYLDAAAVRELSKAGSERFNLVAQPGGALLNSYGAAPWGESLKVTQIDTSVDTDEAGHWEGAFDAKAIAKSLEAEGYKKSEGDGGGEVWTDSGKSGMAFQVSEDEISYSSKGFDSKKGSSLADNKDYRRAAECLGDVYRADFSRLESGDPVRLAVAGQRATSAAKNTEVLCFVVKDDETAERLEAKLRSVVSDEAPKFDGTKVTVEKGERPVVRAVVPDTAEQRPGRLVVSDVELWMAVSDL